MTAKEPTAHEQATIHEVIAAHRRRISEPPSISARESRDAWWRFGYGMLLTAIMVAACVAFAVGMGRVEYRGALYVGLWLSLGIMACCATFTAGISIHRALTGTVAGTAMLRRLGPENPVLVEARHRGDYADFATQLRRNPRPERWRDRDVRRALLTIDEWARRSELR